MAKVGVLDPKAKAAKKKKQAIVLGVLFLALMAFQIPRTLKMLKGSPPPSAAATAPAPAPTPATPIAATPAAPAAGGTAPTTAASVGGDALVVNADLQPAPLDGQLPDLTSFTAKDPFAQQVAGGAGAATAGAAAAAEAAAAAASGARKASAPSTPSTAPPAPPSGAATSEGGSSTGGQGALTPSAPKPPAAPAPISAVLSVNGVQEAVGVKQDFPAASPLFHLVSLTTKTAKISIAGGSLSSGAHALTLELGKPTTLMNTADGTRYVITLISTSTSAAAQPTTASVSPPPATTTTETTP